MKICEYLNQRLLSRTKIDQSEKVIMRIIYNVHSRMTEKHKSTIVKEFAIIQKACLYVPHLFDLNIYV